MTLVLGDVKWLVDKLPDLDRNTEVVILVTNGTRYIKLPVLEVTMDKKLVITCELPEGSKRPDHKATLRRRTEHIRRSYCSKALYT